MRLHRSKSGRASSGRAARQGASVVQIHPRDQGPRTGGGGVSVHSYDYDPDADKIGMQAAEALGEAPQRVLKTLIALVDGKPVCVVLRSDREVSMKKLAAALGGKAAEMMKPAEAERVSGYKIGGVSPFGQTRRLRTAFDADALAEPYVFVNGGQRGLQARLSPHDVARLLDAVVAPITA